MISANIPVRASWGPDQFLVYFWAYFSLGDVSWLHFEDAVGLESTESYPLNCVHEFAIRMQSYYLIVSYNCHTFYNREM